MSPTDITLFFFCQISEESTGSPPLDEVSMEEETTWIHAQLASGALPLFGKSGLPKDGWDLSINKDDIMRFLELRHVQKLDVCMLLSALMALLCLIWSFSLLFWHFLHAFRSPLLLCIERRSA